MRRFELTLVPGDDWFGLSGNGAGELSVVVLDAVGVLQWLDDLWRRGG